MAETPGGHRGHDLGPKTGVSAGALPFSRIWAFCLVSGPQRGLPQPRRPGRPQHRMTARGRGKRGPTHGSERDSIRAQTKTAGKRPWKNNQAVPRAPHTEATPPREAGHRAIRSKKDFPQQKLRRLPVRLGAVELPRREGSEDRRRRRRLPSEDRLGDLAGLPQAPRRCGARPEAIWAARDRKLAAAREARAARRAEARHHNEPKELLTPEKEMPIDEAGR